MQLNRTIKIISIFSVMLFMLVSLSACDAGTWKNAPSGSLTAGNWKLTLDQDGITRTVYVHVPSCYTGVYRYVDNCPTIATDAKGLQKLPSYVLPVAWKLVGNLASAWRRYQLLSDAFAESADAKAIQLVADAYRAAPGGKFKIHSMLIDTQWSLPKRAGHDRAIPRL